MGDQAGIRVMEDEQHSLTQLLHRKQDKHVVICHSIPPSYHISNQSKNEQEFAGGKWPRLARKLNKKKRASGGIEETRNIRPLRRRKT